MHTFNLLWQVFVHAGVPARLAIAAVVLLAANRLAWIPDDVHEWLSDRYQMVGLSWQVWRARVCRREIAPGVHVLCPDGAHGIVVAVLRCGWGPVCCPLAALVSIERLGEAPRVVELSRLLPIDGELVAELDELDEMGSR
ncbi:MAG TPA: hypothetical protein VGM53_34590 [Streptosporangiaceae bacterium]|jgi:hypothetical protein